MIGLRLNSWPKLVNLQIKLENAVLGLQIASRINCKENRNIEELFDPIVPYFMKMKIKAIIRNYVQG